MKRSPTEYTFSAEITQAIVSTLGSLPWAQINQLMTAVMNEVQRQEYPPPEPMRPAEPAPPADADK